MDQVEVDILEQCLTRLEAGASVEDCLLAFPQHRAALELPLRAAARMRTLPRMAMPTTTRAALETQMLAQAAARRAAQTGASAAAGRPSVPQREAGSLSPSDLLAGVLRAMGYRGPLSPTWLRLASAALALLLALAIGTGALAAARAIINLVAPPQPTAVPTQAAQVFTLDGPIEQLGTDSWVVSGIVVRLGPQTRISGTPALGATTHVRGAFQDDGTLLAQSITVDAFVSTPTIAPAPQPTTAPPPQPTATPPPVEPTAVPPAVEPTLAPEPTAQPAREPPPAPAPSGDLFEQLRVLLVAATADGRAGQDGPDLIGRLDLARQSLSNGDRKKAEEQMREIRLKLREKGREGKMDAEFVRQAQALVGAIADTYGLPIPAAEEGGDKPKEDDKADKDDKDDDKGKDD